MTAFLRQRGLLRSAQLIMTVVTSASAVVPLSDLIARGATRQWAGAAVCVTAFVLSVGVTVFWFTRWPTRRQSIAFVVAGNLSIVCWSMTQPTATVAALACTATAVIGGYVAFFHGARLLAFNLAVALAVTVAAAVRIGHEDGLQAALAAFWAICFVELVVPLVIWGTSQAMSVYATRSDEDPLTGLLNRRGFVDALCVRIAGAAATGASYLTMLMVDLDDFKRINDTHGHDEGDRVLREVAELLRVHAPSGALACRAGGEEFLVAAVSPRPADDDAVAAELCTAIAEASRSVTASIGIACAAFDGVRDRAAPVFVEDLITLADKAMYGAKREGGNRVRYA